MDSVRILYQNLIYTIGVRNIESPVQTVKDTKVKFVLTSPTSNSHVVCLCTDNDSSEFISAQQINEYGILFHVSE